MKDIFTKTWIIENAIDVCRQYRDGVLTLRALHYQLVGRGMTNDIQHYKRVVSAMIDARWDGQIAFEKFSDLDREMVGDTNFEKTTVDDKVTQGIQQVDAWMRAYRKNRWENQPIYPEIFIEKKALQGVFQNTCYSWDVALGACKGYPSLTFLYESANRFRTAMDAGKQCVILYFGDYDPSGEDIPRSIQENLTKFSVDVDVRRIALMEHQVKQWNLPPAPAKDTDTRTAAWDGIGQVELDAVRPEQLMTLLENALRGVFDEHLHDELLNLETTERVEYRRQLREYVNGIKE
jgi:hypothetical protein